VVGGLFDGRKQVADKHLSAELFREAVAIAVDEAIRDGKDFSRLQVPRIDAIISELKKHALRRRPLPENE
jgi:hypothetical protein